MLYRPWILGAPREKPPGVPGILDGGEDAPLTPSGRFKYHLVVAAVVVLGVAALAWVRLV